MDDIFKNETKEQTLLRRVFKEIMIEEFGNSKMNPSYKINFSRSLGNDISNYIQNNYSEWFHNQRKKIERDSFLK